MNYPTKVQAICRKKAVSQCYVNLPLPLAAAIDIEPGEIVEWKLLDASKELAKKRYKWFEKILSQDPMP